MIWQLHEATQKFSQVVTRHGEKAVVIITADEYRQLTEKRPDFLEFLLSGPDLSALDLTRSKDLPREIAL